MSYTTLTANCNGLICLFACFLSLFPWVVRSYGQKPFLSWTLYPQHRARAQSLLTEGRMNPSTIWSTPSSYLFLFFPRQPHPSLHPSAWGNPSRSSLKTPDSVFPRPLAPLPAPSPQTVVTSWISASLELLSTLYCGLQLFVFPDISSSTFLWTNRPGEKHRYAVEIWGERGGELLQISIRGKRATQKNPGGKSRA